MLVFSGVVLLGFQPRETFLGCFTKIRLGSFLFGELASSVHSLSPFSLHGLSRTLEAMNEKSPDLRPRLSLVAGIREISNFNLLKDLIKIFDYLKDK